PSRKMSKSYGPEHYVGLMEPEESIRKKIRSAVTDIGLKPGQEMSPGVANLFQILELVAPEELVEELRREHKEGKLLYKHLKEVLYEHLMKNLRPIRERRAELAAQGEIDEILAAGAERARKIAREVIHQARSRVGLE
ncbi:MAG TPA: tryptophan--tRNA ligase, partial [Candidatus Acetothermia bacterium]|nr:tryptophan--tRNA ligase [Candidatus Acetothermia bacterium]